ncbi:spore cortex biosynthesis protein YabQ [Paenibacillus crassostreae]|uniref:Spore cortex biosynthesis protein YabQ n=1 Tax=Paenibacillus crassostreae TaxID=1763538 RepID=A0A167AN55_9BACL|nr:spore cortex biosynthesis protein YabQ [Paenibacillus crassostreae]AOZ92808.1 spore cortex biosynthesis protein YabQ [Paenibacillus crassostreae]OAB71230.1 spore cortex biosynthesis protein YabQ [Paenibacillus crassostreae]
MNPYAQWITLLWMLFSGTTMGLAYDSYRVLSNQFRFPKWTIHLMDFIYWCAMAIFVFRMLYISNQGELRFYAFVGLFLGIWSYFLILSVTTQRFVVMLIKVVQYVLYLLKRLLIVLVWIPIRSLYRMVVGLLGIIWSIVMFILGIVLRCLYPFWKLLKWATLPTLSRLGVPDRIKKWTRICVDLWNRWT